VLTIVLARPGFAGGLAGQTFLITTVRTGDTEVFSVDPDSGDARNL